jgi:hypothetical protein
VTLPTIYEAHFQQSVELFCNAVTKFSSRSRHVAASIGEYGPPEERDRVFVRAKIPNLVHNVLWCLSVLVQIFARNIVLGHLVRADLRFVSATIPEFDRPFCQIAGTGCVLKIGGNKIGFASCRTHFVDCLLAALRITPHNQNMDAELRQFLGCRSTDSARSSGDKCCRRVACYVRFSSWVHG